MITVCKSQLQSVLTQLEKHRSLEMMKVSLIDCFLVHQYVFLKLLIMNEIYQSFDKVEKNELLSSILTLWLRDGYKAFKEGDLRC